MFLLLDFSIFLENLLYHDIPTLVSKPSGDLENENGNETDNQIILMEYQQALDTVKF